jgi:hypothetical protein
MSEAELKELAANIKVNGVQIPILLWWHDEQCHRVDFAIGSMRLS